MRPPLIILAGGRGSRLGHLTDNTPKPMIEIEGKPFLYHLIQHYVNQGFKDISLSTGYLADVVENYPWPWSLRFKRDYMPGKPEEFYYHWAEAIVVNGDTWIEEPLPLEDAPWILSVNDTDAGAQFPGSGEIQILKTRVFYDIGTPLGLETFKEYFKTHLSKS